MTQKRKVVVIDSGIDRSDQLLEDINIEDLYYENGELKQNYEGKVNSHGTEIIKVLLREDPDIEIISIRTLNEDNKCLLSDIINAIKYCISIKADIINLSLGSCSAAAKRIDILRQVCEEASEKGIFIFAADHNVPNMKSYPANFDCVVGVTTSDELQDICHVRYKERVIEFSDNMVYIPDSSKCTIRRGNSYLCPLIVGLFCNFISKQKISNSDAAAQGFMDFLENLSMNHNATKVFFNKYEMKENYALQGKKILFFADDMDINNMRLYGMYKEIGDVNLCFDHIIDESIEKVDDYISEADVFFFGALSNQFINNNQDYLDKLVGVLEKQGKMTITVFPFISTYRRICITVNNNFQIRSIYK